jgi:hypothetical protein
VPTDTLPHPACPAPAATLEGELEVRVDDVAELGRALVPLARLLLALARKERGRQEVGRGS